MKKFMLLALMCAAAGLFAAETSLWDGNAASAKAGADTTVKAENGVMTMTGKSSPTARYSYIIARLNLAPTVFQGKKLALTLHPATKLQSDTIYIKGIAPGGKNVFSYIASTVPAEKKTYILEIGKDSGPFKQIPAQINAPAEMPVVALQFFLGRKVNDSDMQLQISDVKIID